MSPLWHLIYVLFIKTTFYAVYGIIYGILMLSTSWVLGAIFEGKLYLVP